MTSFVYSSLVRPGQSRDPLWGQRLIPGTISPSPPQPTPPHKLWLGCVLTTGRSSITSFGTYLDWWLGLWPSAMLQRNFGFKIKLQFRVTTTYFLHMTCFELLNLEPCMYACTHTLIRSFIVTALRCRHDFQGPLFCIWYSRWNIIMFHEQWPLKCRSCLSKIPNVIQLRVTGQVKQWMLTAEIVHR